MQKMPHFRRYWIFQAMPDRYDLAKKLTKGQSELWPLARHYRDINAGDVVYFWRGGRQAGFYGWGEVTDPPYNILHDKVENSDWKTNVEYQVRFSKPITADQISQSSQSAPLAGLLLFRAAQGTTFKVTTQEGAALNKVITEFNEKAPEDPAGTGSPWLPALSLTPLNFGGTVTRLIGAMLYLTRQNEQKYGGGDALFSLILALTTSGHAPPRGTISFLKNNFKNAKFDEEILAALDQSVSLSKENITEDVVSDELLAIAESARLLAVYSTRKEEIGVRHLLGGLLLASKENTFINIAIQSLSNGWLPLQDLIERFIENTVSTFPEDDASLWMSQFRSGLQERLNYLEQADKELQEKLRVEKSEQPFGEPELKISGPEDYEASFTKYVETAESAMATAFSGRPVPDRPFGADLLQIKSEVAALAHLFALQDDDNTQKSTDRSTFALGLFGRWGSGKSFFIEQLKEQINELSNPKNNTQHPYCKEIIQIDFNAWHYNEANIWASLVHHIFDRLQKHYKALEKDEEFKHIIRELEISQERRIQLDNRIKEKEQKKKKLISKINRLEKNINTLVTEEMKKMRRLSKKIASNQAAKEKLLELLPDFAELLGLPAEDLKKKIQKGNQNATGLLTLLQESGAAAGRGQVLLKTILHSAFSKFFIITACIILILYFNFPKWLGKPDLWNDFLSGAGQAIALITPVLIWVRDRLLKATNLFSQIGGVEMMLKEGLRIEQEQKDENLLTLRAQQESLSREIEDALNQKNTINTEIMELQSKLDELGSAESLVDYINDRATSDDYRSQLGILALIRQDFEKLSNLMTGSNHKEDIEKDETPEESEEESKQLPDIERIILYIDDLDRVQNSRKVLQVLEAVHLLLAFPLFHVVVAVDERWAARSVLSHHSDFFGIKELTQHSEDHEIEHEKSSFLELIGAQPATPREFLEKIFQISFWVRPLTDQLSEKLIEGIVTNNGQDSSSSLPENHMEYRFKAATEDDFISEIKEEPPPQENPETGKTKKTKPITGRPEQINHNEKSSREDHSNHIEATPNYPERDASPAPIHFEITNEELVTMRALAPVIGRSPRTVKRFINTYRLFKVMKISPGEESYTSAEIDEHTIFENHVPIMILLSIQVGHPDVAVRFYELIDQALNENDSDLMGPLIEEWKQLPQKNKTEEHKWLHALNALLSVHDLYGTPSFLKDQVIGSFNPWLLSTSRFGFQEWISKRNLINTPKMP